MARNKTGKQNQQARKREEKRRRNRLQQRKNMERANDNRLEVRFAKQVATAWQGETPEDVSLFDDVVLARLPVELATECKWVREALKEACQNRSGPALEQLADIPRRSPFAEWRIFLRGLETWKQESLTEAKDIWARLDRSRRAWRIAAALIAAHRDDLSEIRQLGLAKYCADSTSGDPWLVDSDDQLLKHAKLVRQTQIERIALGEAHEVTKLDDSEVPDATVNYEHIRWLKSFTERYQKVDPGLVQALHQTAVARAFCGPYTDIFQQCTQYFRGMAHDRNHLLMCAYYLGSENPKKVIESFQRYLKNDLYRNHSLPPALRSAMISQVFCHMAAVEAYSGREPRSSFSFFSRVPDHEAMIEYFEQALEAYPANRTAHEGYEAIYRDLLSNDQLLKADRDELQAELAALQERRLQHLPDDIETRLELVDYLLESERSEQAQVHVQWLVGTPRENPLADAMTWKWSLLEAMRMCRRKAWIGFAREHLDAAEQEWPLWLSQDWLPYLRAAVRLRGGDRLAFDEMPTEARVSGKLADVCMRLGAAQKMSVDAAGLKTLRTEVEQLQSNIKDIPVSDLLSAASFYWDLHRTGLKYPAYRMHGTKFLMQLCDCFNASPQLVTGQTEDRSVQAALLIMANEGLFNQGYEARFPLWLLEESVLEWPIANAAIVTAAGRAKFQSVATKYQTRGTVLSQAAASSADPFYRHLFLSLANQLESKIEQYQVESRNPLAGMFKQLRSLIEEFQVDDEFDDESDDIDHRDDECDCPACRMKRGEL